MDRLTLIEEEMASVLRLIDGQPTSNGYTYYSTTGTIEIEDQAISYAVNTDQKNVDYTIEQDTPEVNQEWGDFNTVYTNEVFYTLRARVKNTDTVNNPRREIKKRCNEVLSDIKKAFGIDHTLNGNVNWIKYDRSAREYNANNDVIHSADLIVVFSVNYGQSINNPDEVGCN